ncbi:MAG: CU044_2847 family protein [Planctomycetaceae bacterium]
MSVVKKVSLSNGEHVLVEMVEAQLPDVTEGSKAAVEYTDGRLVDVLNAFELLKPTLGTVLRSVHDSISESGPSEWGVEFSIGFKGTVSPLPVIVTGESSASLKVHAKWKASTNG